MRGAIHGLYTIADSAFRPEFSPSELAEAYLKGGAGIVQLRMKAKSEKRKAKIYEEAKNIMALKEQYPFTFIVNDYVEVALEVGADGVHVGVEDMPVAKIREMVGDKMLIGYSSHSLEEAVAAEKAGADYVAFGAIFPTKTKGPGHPVQGLEKLHEVVKALRVPVVAIGGINKRNIKSVLETGVSSVAMITALTEAPDISKETQFYAACFSDCRF